MTNLTELGVKAIRDGVAAGDFSAREVAEAFNANVAAAAALNAFIAAETGKVASTLPAATPAVDNRGFNKPTGPDGAIYSSISGEFRGWSQGSRFTLDNGQVWQVADSTARLRVKLEDPKITIEPGALGAWFMKVEGYNARAAVKRIK